MGEGKADKKRRFSEGKPALKWAFLSQKHTYLLG